MTRQNAVPSAPSLLLIFSGVWCAFWAGMIVAYAIFLARLQHLPTQQFAPFAHYYIHILVFSGMILAVEFLWFPSQLRHVRQRMRDAQRWRSATQSR